MSLAFKASEVGIHLDITGPALRNAVGLCFTQNLAKYTFKLLLENPVQNRVATQLRNIDKIIFIIFHIANNLFYNYQTF